MELSLKTRNISVTKWSLAAKFYQFSLFTETFFSRIALKIGFVVFVYELINYLINYLFIYEISFLYTWLCNKPVDCITK